MKIFQIHKFYVYVYLLGIGFFGGCITEDTYDIQKEEIKKCNSDFECTVVQAGYCGGAMGINRKFSAIWKRHLKELKKQNEDVECEPKGGPSIYNTVPKCQNNTCVAVSK